MEPKASWNDADLAGAMDTFLTTHTVTTVAAPLPGQRPDGWSDSELEQAVVAYSTMLATPVKDLNKAQVYLDLAVAIDRTEDAVERRMLNISSILKRHGQPVVSGLNPSSASAQHVGGQVEPRLLDLLSRHGLMGPQAQQRAELTEHWGTVTSPTAQPTRSRP